MFSRNTLFEEPSFRGKCFRGTFFSRDNLFEVIVFEEHSFRGTIFSRPVVQLNIGGGKRGKVNPRGKFHWAGSSIGQVLNKQRRIERLLNQQQRRSFGAHVPGFLEKIIPGKGALEKMTESVICNKWSGIFLTWREKAYDFSSSSFYSKSIKPRIHRNICT
jgi:hypothetical protein